MGSFISYLYEYREGKPSHNVGFVKVDQGKARTVLHIHGKGLRLGRERTISVSLLFLEDDTPMCIRQEKSFRAEPGINGCLIYDESSVGGRGYYQRIAGILLESSDGRRFAAAWDGKPLEMEKAKAFEEPQEILEQKTEVEPEVDEYIVPTRTQCRKIQRREIAMLPRCEWRLANNSFLVHGYANYHHLILTEDEDGLWLGVPGIYHRQEARAAEAFGFPRFIPVDDEDTGAEEETPGGDFGYWCRRVKGSLKW